MDAPKFVFPSRPRTEIEFDDEQVTIRQYADSGCEEDQIIYINVDDIPNFIAHISAFMEGLPV